MKTIYSAEEIHKTVGNKHVAAASKLLYTSVLYARSVYNCTIIRYTEWVFTIWMTTVKSLHKYVTNFMSVYLGFHKYKFITTIACRPTLNLNHFDIFFIFIVTSNV